MESFRSDVSGHRKRQPKVGMQTANRFALKEWAVVCCALARGRQTILLRSGGIADGREGFSIQHDEFWLFATRFHQSADELVPDAAPLLEAAAESHPPEGMIRLPLYATVERAYQVYDTARLSRLAHLHILNSQTVLNRFHYRQPGLSLLLVRAYLPPRPIDLPDSPHFSGCHSWVELPTPVPTDDLEPLLSDDEFAIPADALAELFPGPI